MPIIPDSKAHKAMGRRLKLVRELRAIRQEDLAEAVGYSTTALSAWESGRNRIDVVALGRLVDVLGVTADYIILGREGGISFELVMELRQRDAQHAMNDEPKRGRPRKQPADPLTFGQRPQDMRRPSGLREKQSRIVPPRSGFHEDQAPFQSPEEDV